MSKTWIQKNKNPRSAFAFFRGFQVLNKGRHLNFALKQTVINVDKLNLFVNA